MNQLFTDEPVIFPPDLERLITPIISESENTELTRIPTTQEIKESIFEMNGKKALGLDGLHALFYKRYRNIVGNAVIEAIQSFYRTSKLLKEINNSFIVRIP